MSFDINQFKQSGLVYQGARPSKFNVLFNAPPGLTTGLNSASIEKFTFTCHSASLPESTLGEIEVAYFGRKIKEPGDRTFSDWDVSIYNDEDFGVRSMFESWSNAINALQSNIATTSGSQEDFKTDLLVQQFSKDGEIIRSYAIIGAFPLTVGKINLSWDTQNTIEEFDVSFAYDYWLPVVETSTKIAGGTNPYLSAATVVVPN